MTLGTRILLTIIIALALILAFVFYLEHNDENWHYIRIGNYDTDIYLLLKEIFSWLIIDFVIILLLNLIWGWF